MTSLRPLLILTLTLAACGARSSPSVDLGSDAAPADLGVDAGPADAGPVDAGPVDAGDGDASSDGGGACATDSECTSGVEWCVEGACVPCDNSAFLCDILCEHGWGLYERNGCHPCACAPSNECRADTECAPGSKCAAGAFCWCSGDPACCQGNRCVPEACEGPPPVGCVARGCPAGETCNPLAGCASSGCACDTSSGHWNCLPDCSGGICQPDP